MDDGCTPSKLNIVPGQPETLAYRHLLGAVRDTVKAIAIARASIHAAVTDKQPIDWKAWVYDIFEPFDIVDTRDGRSEMQHRAGVIQHLRDAMRPVEQSLIATATPEPRSFSGVSGETAVHALLRYCDLFVDIANQLRFLSMEGSRKKLKPFAPVVLKLNETWRRTIETTSGVELRSFIEPLGREQGQRLLLRARREAVEAEKRQLQERFVSFGNGRFKPTIQQEKLLRCVLQGPTTKGTYRSLKIEVKEVLYPEHDVLDKKVDGRFRKAVCELNKRFKRQRIWATLTIEGEEIVLTEHKLQNQ